MYCNPDKVGNAIYENISYKIIIKHNMSEF